MNAFPFQDDCEMNVVTPLMIVVAPNDGVLPPVDRVWNPYDVVDHDRTLFVGSDAPSGS